jgi:hypothetical protein
VVLRSIFTYSNPQQWPALRLASKQLADVGVEFIGCLTIRSWAKQQVPPAALLTALRQRIKLLQVVGKPDWSKLQRLLSYKAKHAGPRRTMPQMRRITLQEPNMPLAIPSSLATLLQGINRLDITCPGTLTLPRFAKLPALHTAGFGCTVSLAQLAQLAPNLEQLWANVLDCSPSSLRSSNRRNSRRSRTAAAGATACCLPLLTHLGCRTLTGINLGTAAAGDADKDAAPPAADNSTSLFPSLQVLTCLPSVAAPCSSTVPQAADNSNSSSRSSFDPCIFQPGALGPCPRLQSVRISGNFGYGSAAAALQQLLDSPVELDHLTRLSLHSGSRCISAFTCINALSQLQPLQHLTVTGSCSRPSRVALLLEQLALLPQLQSLALPAELLCSKCCRSGASGLVQHALDKLVMQSSSLTRLVFLPGAAGRLQQAQHSSSANGGSNSSTGGDGGSTSCAGGKCGRTDSSSCAGEGSSVAQPNNSSSTHNNSQQSDSGSSTSSSSSGSACSACTHPNKVSQQAAALYSAWQAAAAFEGLCLASSNAADKLQCAAPAPADESRTLSSMRQRWQQGQQQAKQQEHQQRMQRLQQLTVQLVGLPCGSTLSCSASSGDNECRDASGTAEYGSEHGLDVMNGACVWGVYGPTSEW